MDLFSLPVEILEEVLDHLHTNDLLSCSLVCKAWRSGINQDFIWRQKCMENKYDRNLMDKSKSHKFIEEYDTTNEEEDSMESLCTWRNIYNWYCNLAGKWLNGNFVKYKFNETKSPIYCLDCDNETVVTGHEDSNINVWSVSSVPFHLTTIRCLLSDYPILSIRINNNILIAQQKKLLQAYYNKDGKFVLIDAKSFEVGENNIEQMERINKLGIKYEKWYKECLRMNEIYSNKSLVYNLCDKTLYATNSNSSLIWSWTLPENEVFCYHEVHQNNIRQIEYENGDIYLIVGLDVTQLLILDKKTDHFKTIISVPGTKHFIIDINLILGVPSPGDNYFKRLWVWNKKDYYKYPRTRDITSIHHSAVIALHKLIVYSENGQIKVWDTDQDALISSFSIGTSIGFLKNGFSSGLIIFLNSNIYLWDWKIGQRITCLNNSLEWIGDFRQLLWVNPTMIIIGVMSYMRPEMFLEASLTIFILTNTDGSSGELTNEDHKTRLASKLKNELYCYHCDTMVEGDKCINLEKGNKSTLSKKCDGEELVCMVKRYSFTTSTENSTSVLRMWSLKRNCTAKCEPGCIIIGERTKLYGCTTCCTTTYCNYGKGLANDLIINKKLIILLALLSYLLKYS